MTDQPTKDLRQVKKKTETRRFLKEFASQNSFKRSLKLILQDWEDPYNVGSLFRVADACGAAEVICTGRTPVPPHPQISVTSIGNHRRVAWKQVIRHDDAIREMHEERYQVVAVEVAEGAVSYREFEYSDKVCLVLGSEKKGVYPNVLKQCDGTVIIPMAGKGRSLNVVVAGVIVAYEVLLK